MKERSDRYYDRCSYLVVECVFGVVRGEREIRSSQGQHAHLHGYQEQSALE